MNETSIDTANNTDNNSNRDPFSFTSLCYSEQKGTRIPVYPYVVAFTGHRDFAKPGELDGFRGYTEDDVKNQFKNELKRLATSWKEKSKGCAPLILLTGLADGTDQIVAQAALELKDLNVKLIAVLPMDRDTFELTLNAKNKQTYRDLLDQAYDIYELPLKPELIGHEKELKEDAPQAEDYRRIQYRYQAEFISLHSHLHFVFWDGISANSKGGGTSETVMFKLQGNVTPQENANLLTFSSIGPVVQFLLPRNDEANKKEKLSDDLSWDKIPVFYWTRDRLRKLGKVQPDRSVMTEDYRLKTSVAEFEDVQIVIDKIGELNAQGVEIYQESTTAVKKQDSWDNLFGIENDPDKTDPETLENARNDVKKYLDEGTNAFVDHYVIADMLASKFQNATFDVIKKYAKATFFFILFSGLLNLPKALPQNSCNLTFFLSIILVSCYIAALVKALHIVFHSNAYKYHYKYHEYRAIAEALRVQIFWRIAAMSGCVSGFYRSHQIFKTEWLRAAVNSLDVLIPSPKADSSDAQYERIEFVKEKWVKKQQDFYTDRIAQRRKSTRLDKYLPRILIVITIIPLIPAFLWNTIHQLLFSNCLESQSSFFIYVILISVAFIAAYCKAKSIKAQKDIKKFEAERYEREVFPFDRAELLLLKNLATAPNEEENINQKEEDIKFKQNILRQLGEETLAGNSDWLLSVTKRSLSFKNVKFDDD